MVSKCLLILHSLNAGVSPPVEWQLPDSAAFTETSPLYQYQSTNEFWLKLVKPYLVSIKDRSKAQREYINSLITQSSAQIEPYFIIRNQENLGEHLSFLTWPLLRKALHEFTSTNEARENEYDLRGRLRLLHQQGSTPLYSTASDPISRQLLAEANGKIIVDVGAAYGNLTLPLLEAGAKKVIAIDRVLEQLAILAMRTPPARAGNLLTLHAQFPLSNRGPYQWRPNSIDSFAFFRVFQFMRGPTIERALKQAYQALVPGGKVYVLGDSPYLGGPLQRFPQVYEKRLLNRNIKWPGIVDNIHRLSPNNRDLPKFLHLLDDVILRRALERAGFIVERSELVPIPQVEDRDDLRLDGRERVIASAVKPYD